MSNENHRAPRAVPFSTTLLVRDSCLCLHVQRAARTLARRFDEALKPAGLTNGQFSLLMSLNRPASAPGSASPHAACTTPDAADQTAAVPMRDVATLLGMDRTTLTAAVKTLQRRNLLQTLTSPTDRRNRLLQLTPTGLTTLAAAVPIWLHEHQLLDQELPDVPHLLTTLRHLA